MSRNDNMLRIGYVFDRSLPGPTTDCEQVVRNVHALRALGADIRLVVPSREQSGPNESVAGPSEVQKHYQLSEAIPMDSIACAPALTEWQRKQRYPKCVTASQADKGFDVIYTRNLPVVRHYVNNGRVVVYDTYRVWGDQLPMVRPWLRDTLNSPHCIGVVLHSDYARQRYAAMGIQPEKMLVAYNGFDPKFFQTRPTKLQAREALGLPHDRPIATYSGHVNFTKGLWALLQIAKRRPDYLFLLVGVQNLPFYERVTRYLTRSNNVKLVPWCPMSQVVQHLFASDVLLIPPSSVPLSVIGHTVLPMKIFLYLAVGRPILASRTRDVVELLKDGENSVLVAPGNINEAVEKLGLLKADPEFSARLGANALAQSEQLTWAERAKQVYAFVQQRFGDYASGQDERRA